VHTRNGFTVTLWTYYEPVTPHTPPADYANALQVLHVGMREVDLPSPSFTDRIVEAAEVVPNPNRSPELADPDRVFLSDRLESLRRAIDDRGAVEQLIHGEPHQDNVLSTKHGPLFIDLETFCRGPVEFDLAHVPRRSASTNQTLTKGCSTSADSSFSRWSQRGVGSWATSFPMGGDSERNSCARCARILLGRHSK